MHALQREGVCEEMSSQRSFSYELSCVRVGGEIYVSVNTLLEFADGLRDIDEDNAARYVATLIVRAATAKFS